MKKILIVEDEENVAKVLKLVLDTEGYQVTIALDGEEALGKIAQNPPDLVVTDLSMPKIDGSKLCQIIKSSPKYNSIKVIICSALQQSLANEKLHLPADDFIVKPVDYQILVEKVKKLIG